MNKGKLDNIFLAELVMGLTKLIMTCNIFEFGNTSWLQITGTAMGTPIACTYTIVYYAWHEKDDLLNEYGDNLYFLVRYINNVFGIWLWGPVIDWTNFKYRLDEFRQLEWTPSELSHTHIILDLTVRIKANNFITIETYQKPMNLYFYIAAHSAHPPRALRLLVIGSLLRYWK